jgi:hypothetical protein
VPSLEEVIPRHCFELPVEVTSDHVAPELVEVQMFPFQAVAANFVPSLEAAILVHSWLPVGVTSVHVPPESVDLQMFPPPSKLTAASLVPSLEDVMLYQYFVLPTEESSVQVAPESVEVQIFPFQTAAASLVPSLEEVMPYHAFLLPVKVTSLQVTPESVEIQMLPDTSGKLSASSKEAAASLVPSLEDVIWFQCFVIPTEKSSVQIACVSEDTHTESRATSRTFNTLRRGISLVRLKQACGEDPSASVFRL